MTRAPPPGAFEHRGRTHEDEVGCQVLGQAQPPFVFVGEEDVEHELIDSIRKGRKLAVAGHRSSLAEADGHSGSSGGPDIEPPGRILGVVRSALVRFCNGQSCRFQQLGELRGVEQCDVEIGLLAHHFVGVQPPLTAMHRHEDITARGQYPPQLTKRVQGLGSRNVYQRVETHDARDRFIQKPQGGHVALEEGQGRMVAASLCHHARGQVDPDDVQAQGGEERSDMARTASDVAHRRPRMGGRRSGKSSEQLAIEWFGVQFVPESVGICRSHAVVGGGGIGPGFVRRTGLAQPNLPFR
jgi:hypothetical protein